MPSRPNREQRIDSPEVQGDDSFVTLRKLEVSEVRKLQEEGRRKHWGDYKMGQEFMARRVVEWNWVDDHGDPLPQPVNDPSVIERLTEDEMFFLSSIIQDSLPDLKNSRTSS